MKYFGKIYKKFRESRGLKIRDVATAGLSASQLSRFEHEETDLTISKFMMALDEINMPIEEFMYVAHGFKRDEISELVEKIQDNVAKRNVVGLKMLLIKQLETTDQQATFHKLNSILLKIRLQVLSGEKYYSKKDILFLTDYLISVQYWGNYEMLLFINTLDVLPHSIVMLLSREMLRRSDYYKEIPTNKKLITTMLLNVFLACIERCEFEDAKYFERQLEQSHFSETEMYERLILLYVQNLYNLKTTGNRVVVIEMRKCIGAMKLAGSYGIATTFENHLQVVLEEVS